MSIAKSRHEIRDQHESAVIEAFSRFLRNNGHQVAVLPRPDEPKLGDGLLKIDHYEQWIEIVDVHTKESEAKELWQSVTPGERPLPRKLSIEESVQPREFHVILVEEIKKKFNKIGYRDSLERWGAGTLICDCQDPLVDYDWPAERMFIEPEFTSTNWEELQILNKDIFKDIYLYAYGSGLKKFYLLSSF